MNQITLENFKIDKSNWKKVKLGDVVFEPQETVKDPVKEGIQHVVGLEHIDSEDIHLRRSASIDESTTFTKKFRKGDVLFGRRRAYLKKAAVAEFDGICSGDITVMRAKDGLMTKLLPFVINNDKFFDYAVTHSAGGLSPRVKFKDLSNYVFTLPVQTQQLEISDLLSTNNDLIQIYLVTLNCIKSLLVAIRNAHFNSKSGKLFTLGQLAEVRAGVGFPLKYQGHNDKEIMFFKVADMNAGYNLRELTTSEHTVSIDDVKEIKGKLHEKGTVVFPKVGAAIATEKKRILVKDSLIDNNVMGVSSKNKSLLPPEYLLEFFNTVSLKKISNTGAVPSINADIIKNIEIFIPDKEVIDLYLNQITSLLKLESATIIALNKTISLKTSLVNQIF